MLPWPCVEVCVWLGQGVCVRFVRSGQVEWCLTTRGLLYFAGAAGRVCIRNVQGGAARVARRTARVATCYVVRVSGNPSYYKHISHSHASHGSIHPFLLRAAAAANPLASHTHALHTSPATRYPSARRHCPAYAASQSPPPHRAAWQTMKTMRPLPPPKRWRSDRHANSRHHPRHQASRRRPAVPRIPTI